ncbi:MAG: NADH-quinone oxidoreductase subunit C [Dehalococcoidia bacterium]|nr:MAG: NADH-quinone oxidoreductase subunit C [Dehalococcoidia bacterium]
MTQALSSSEIADRLKDNFADAITEIKKDCLIIKGDSLLDIASFLKNTPDLDFDYLSCITCVDFKDYFELVYQLLSIKHNHSLVLKTQCYQRDKPVVNSMVDLWKGADFQEREIYDLMGIRFKGHPNMKRIFLWDGFQGHPLRKENNNDAEN